MAKTKNSTKQTQAELRAELLALCSLLNEEKKKLILGLARTLAKGGNYHG